MHEYAARVIVLLLLLLLYNGQLMSVDDVDDGGRSIGI